MAGENNVIKRLTASSTWGASSDLTPIDRPREGLITEIKIRANITATLTATALDDFFRRVIQNIRILGDGGRAFLGMGGTQMSVMLSLLNEMVYGGQTIHSNGAGIALAGVDVGSTSFISEFVFHPGSNPQDPFDTTVVIPASALSTLQALITTTAAAVTDANGVITAGTYNYEVNEVLGIKPSRGMMTPMGSTLTYAHTANFTDFGYKIDMPAGAWLRGILICVRDDTATVPRRKDDEVTHIRIERPKRGDYILEQSIYEAKSTMVSRFRSRNVAGDVGPIGAIATIRPAPTSGLDNIPAGFVYIDLRPFGHPMYGLDLTGAQTGDYKLAMTIANFAAGDATTIYWDQLVPFQG
jgi:hypothetical protein